MDAIFHEDCSLPASIDFYPLWQMAKILGLSFRLSSNVSVHA